MDAEEYDRQLRKLGLSGPMGELRLDDGTFVLVYKMPDRSRKHLAPPSSLTPEQRADVIAELKRHLGIIATRRGEDLEEEPD